MPLVFAAVVPHSPLLVPAVAKDHLRLVTQTRTALAALAAESYARQLDAIFLLTPHGAVWPDVVVANLADTLTGSLVQFGDVQTRLTVRGAVATGHRFKERAVDAGFPLQLQTVPDLDYGSVVPLTFFLAEQPQLPILPLHVWPDVPLMARLGQLLADFFSTRPERFGLIASADLWRAPNPGITGPRRPTAAERTVAEALSAVDASALSAIHADEPWCGLGPLLALISTAAIANARGVIRSFEAPLDVGLLSASFTISA